MKSTAISYWMGFFGGLLTMAIFASYNQPYQYTCECKECSKWFKVVTSEELNEKQREFVRNFCACDKIERGLK